MFFCWKKKECEINESQTHKINTGYIPKSVQKL